MSLVIWFHHIDFWVSHGFSMFLGHAFRSRLALRRCTWPPEANRPIPRPFRSASRSASARSVFSSLFSTMEPGTLKPNLHSTALSMLDEWWVEHVERNQLWTWMFIVVPTPHFFQRAMSGYVTCVDRISSDMNIHEHTWYHMTTYQNRLEMETHHIKTSW